MREKEKILITGAGGMLGSDLVKELRDAYNVLGLGRVECDVTNPTAVRDTFRKFAPDLVIHAAAYTDVDGCEKDRKRAYTVNVLGTQNVCEAIGEKEIPLIFLSTDYIFDGKKPTPYREEDLPAPLNYYGETKLLGEQYIQKNLNRYLIIRATWLYGEKGRNFVDKVLELSRSEKQLRIVDDQVGSPTYTVDLAQGIRKLIGLLFGKRSFGSGVFFVHLTNSGQTSWFGFAEEILHEMGSSHIPLLPISSEELDRPAKRPKNSVLDNTHYVDLVREPLRHWKRALQDFLAIRKRTVYV